MATLHRPQRNESQRCSERRKKVPEEVEAMYERRKGHKVASGRALPLTCAAAAGVSVSTRQFKRALAFHGAIKETPSLKAQIRQRPRSTLGA